MDDTYDIRPFQYLIKALSGWKVILSISIFFGLIGLGVSSLLPPVFQSSSVLQVDIDHEYTKQMNDYTVMKAYERVRGVLLADDVLEESIDTVIEEGADPGEFSGIAAMRERIRVSQRSDGWELVVYSHDPQLAATLANAWADSSIQNLEDGFRHSLMAWKWQGALYSAHCSLGLDPDDESRTLWTCTTGGEDIDPNSIADALLEEVQQTRGILPIFSFSILERAAMPETPVLWQRGTFVLIGLLLGLVVGFLWIVGRPGG